MFVALLIIQLLAVAADVLHLRTLHRRGELSRVLAVWTIFTALLPVMVMGVSFLLPDNTTLVMRIAMWAIWLWVVVVPRRMLFYLLCRMGLRRTGYAVGFIMVALLVWGTTVGRTRIRVSRVEIASPNIPAGFDGMRIAHISDIHLGTLVNPEKELTRLADTLNSLNPELVMFTGDLVNIRSTELDERHAALLQLISAPVFSVTGNHDVGTYIKDSIATPAAVAEADIVARQRAADWHVLMDSTVRLERGGDTITLTGISYDASIRDHRHDREGAHRDIDAAYRGVDSSLYNITLAHLPQLWDRIRATEYGDLTLSGHVHSMQMKIPVGERGWSLAALMYERWGGLYTEAGKSLYINDGIGYVGYPLRMGAAPEVTLITLKRCE